MCCNPCGVISSRSSATVQQFLRSRFDSNPNINPAAWRTDSQLANRGRMRSISAPYSSTQSSGSMLDAAVSAVFFFVFTTNDDPISAAKL